MIPIGVRSKSFDLALLHPAKGDSEVGKARMSLRDLKPMEMHRLLFPVMDKQDGKWVPSGEVCVCPCPGACHNGCQMCWHASPIAPTLLSGLRGAEGEFSFKWVPAHEGNALSFSQWLGSGLDEWVL